MMKSPHIKWTVLLALTCILPTVASAEDVYKSMSAEGQGQFFDSDGESIARMKAKDALEKVCKDAGMRLYEGRYDLKEKKYMAVDFRNTTCKEKNGRKRCKTTATGMCISKESESFWFSCGKNKKPARGKMMLWRNVLTIIPDDGRSVIRLNTNATDKEMNDALGASLCQDSEDPTLLQRLKSYFLKKVKNHPGSKPQASMGDRG